ncbi:MAG: 50S ribosomal protein L3 [Parcubacteria group bacterium CG_4_9_14_0_2_um_filter_35_11]|nr:MAG: 50S ribosomal protein L3 [Parcubacteria group bacterium CG_4_9_14_0_2_um_filter_35_11]
MKFILGRKIGMSQIFDEKGKVIPLTWVEAGPCFVTQIKTKEKDEYEAMQVGFIKKKTKHIKKTEKEKGFRYLREFQGATEENQKLKSGAKIDVTVFSEGDIVKISGLSKGKGFQGVVKRWGFAGLPKTHGTKHMLRMPGSIGQSGPERVFKGKKMAGRMGNKRMTVKNLKVIKIDKEKNLIGIKGAVPGTKGTLLEILSK